MLWSGRAEFVVWQVFCEYFGFPCQFSFHTHHSSSGAGIIGQLVGDVPSGLSLTPAQETKKKKKKKKRNTAKLHKGCGWMDGQM
jgi:hypothetical protein